MKKQLLLLTLGAIIASPLCANGQKRKHHGGRKTGIIGAARQEYRNTFNIINANANQLNPQEKQGLISSLIAHFNGKAGLPRFNQQQQEIYAAVTKTFDDLKKFEAEKATKKAARKSKLLGTEGRKKHVQRRHYSPSRHFAQKVLGTILYPNPTPALTVKPAGATAQKLTSPALPLKKSWKGTTRIGTEGISPEKIYAPRTLGPKSGTTRAGVIR